MSGKVEKKIGKKSEDNDEKLTTNTDIKNEQKTDDDDEIKGNKNEDRSKTGEISGKSETDEYDAIKSNDDEISSKDEIAKKKKKMPKAIFFILGNEFCERFSFYGMRTILTLYLIQRLNYSDNGAAKIYHGFKMTAYFMPLLGAILADSLLGRFWTILYISIVYAFGNIITAAGSIPEKLSVMNAISITGLFIVAVGTGGIKPCVSAFGGDQFESSQVKERQKFFSMFYFVINGGSLFSTALTPVLRGDVRCFGQDRVYK